ncbi:MAG: methylated-DNA--[protein]-cysteine S-methyltransferase [Rhodobacteraceae bacterium]|nr:methylated-DNA--[protein]-cysteine S-methyltransferase [Paracoccaceae bacterium]
MKRAATDSPFGPLTVVEDGGEIVALEWRGGGQDASPLLASAIGQLAEYFGGRRTAFDLPLRFGGGFRGRFLRALAAIPFGRTRTYGELARELGVSPQAVGQACGGNPIPILIPCHRVLAQCGLGGFSAPGGIETKVALLRHETAAGLLI